MSAHREAHLELCAGLMLGSLDEADRIELEAHLAGGCAECERDLARLSEGVVAFAASVPAATPPPALRARILERARAEGPSGSSEGPLGSRSDISRTVPFERRRRVAPATWVWAAAAALLAVGTLALWLEAERLRGRLAANDRQIAELRRRLDEERGWAALLDSPTSRVVQLALTPQAAQVLRAVAVYDSTRGRALVVFENLVAPPGSDYQLWAIRDDGPSSLGVIQADATGRAVLRIRDFGDPASLRALAVSLEGKGGSPHLRQPLGPVVMVGKLGG